jgi:hypothetical protein
MHSLDFLALWSMSSSPTLRVDVADSLATWLQAGAAVFTAVALGIAGIWAYFRFRNDRTYMPRCSIDLNCSVTMVDSRAALVVNVGVTNCGDTEVAGIGLANEARFLCSLEAATERHSA